MKMVALAVVAFGMLTSIYGSAVVVPRVQEANSAWSSAPRDSPGRDRLESARYELRGRGQTYAIACIVTGVLGLALAIVSRKKPGFPPFALLLGGALVTLAGFGVIQGIGNVF